MSRAFYLYMTLDVIASTFYIHRNFLENYFCKYVMPSKTLYFKAEKPEPENLETFIT